MSEHTHKIVDGALVPLTPEEIAALDARDAEIAAQPPPPPEPPSLETQLFYDHENRLRSLEGQPPLTLQDIVNKMKGA